MRGGDEGRGPVTAQFGLLLYVVGTWLPRSVTSSNVEHVRHLKTTANATLRNITSCLATCRNAVSVSGIPLGWGGSIF